MTEEEIADLWENDRYTRLVTVPVVLTKHRCSKELAVAVISEMLPMWRVSDGTSDLINLARFGNDKDLDQLMYNKQRWGWRVREAVALRGRDGDLEILVADPEPEVRAAVARVGRDCDLDRLVYDPDDFVRYAVACQGREDDLDILAHDTDSDVALMARKQLHKKKAPGQGTK